MAKLRTVRPALARSSPPLARAAKERKRLATRDDDREWRKWYSTARWKRLREEALVAASYTCAKTGRVLTGKHPSPDSPVVDHIKPHRGDPDLFWDPDNLQVVSKEWHDSIKQAQERADQVAAIHPKWLQPSVIPLTIVCGPPCSGKTTWADAHAAPRDLVIDLDRIASDISGEPLHGWSRERWLNAALWRRNDMLGSLSRPAHHPAAWLVVSEPKARHRDWWATTLKPQRIVVLEADEAECMRRAAADGRDIDVTEAGIMRWWADYDRRIGDERLV
ncbi:AAA family ATPase [Rhodobacter sp. NTK016B]|uniref:AAA family ATPase n=1 Tax=Rhodobacter sp. NTK016B TaxID=2759676 RepID=UPI001A8E1ADA|nr:AAA family ATPase [Rhodobacter sp. NTK016B]MBN8292831.1 AAA family ATPase [Rhodobacter sp. NTK016B]